MTYEQALQIAIEVLDDASDYLTSVHDGFPTADQQVDELMSASNALRKALEEREEKYATKVVAMHEDGTYTTEQMPIQKREWVGLTDEERSNAWAQTKGDVLLRLVPFARAIEAKLKEKNSE